VDARAPTLLPRFDPLAPEVLDDPYPVYARLRDAGPLCRGPLGTRTVTRHAEVAALLNDGRLGSAFPEAYHRVSAGEGAAAAFLARIILYRDPPEHTRMRRLIGSAFAPQVVRGLQPRIARLVDDLLEPLLEAGRMDVVGDLALPLPVLVVCELMGIPAVDHQEIRPKATDLGRAFAAIVPGEARAAADAAVVWLQEYLRHLLTERRLDPRDDLLSRLLTAREGDYVLADDDIVDNAVFAFFAGFETTTNLIGNGFAALLEHPDQLARLQQDATLAGTAVDEFLRFDPPVQGVARFVREPVEVGGRTIKPGRVVNLLIGSANRDERVFADADHLDVGRTPNPHVSFGGGPHRCLGATLARLEATVVLARVLSRCDGVEPGGVRVRSRASSFRGYDSLPVVLHRSKR
jgi:cytochrome P450